MRILIVFGVAYFLMGCVSEHAELRNDQGQVVQCSNEGWGWLGAPMAAANQSNCIKKAETAGFHKASIAQTATPAQTKAKSEAAQSPEIKGADTSKAKASVVSEPTAVDASSGPASHTSNSVADRLSKLDELFKSGIITKEEYDQKRKEILSSL